MAATRWGEAIARLLSDRGWTKRQLADAASVRPNTITNLLKHGRDADTTTLIRIAKAFDVDIAELFLTREQSVALLVYRDARMEQLKERVVRGLSATIGKLVEEQLQHTGTFVPMEAAESPKKPVRRSRRRRPRARR